MFGKDWKCILRGAKKRRKSFAVDDLPAIVVESPLGTRHEYVEDVFNFDMAEEDKSYRSQISEAQDDLPPPLGEEPDGKRLTFRRNSVSLPNLEDLELQVLQDKLRIQDEDVQSDSSNESVLDFTDDELVMTPGPGGRKVPLRHVRRKSVTHPRMLKIPGDDESSTLSPVNSITSVNSLASLLKEKLQMVPSTIKKKKPRDYKIRTFVAILFLTVVFLVGLAYVLYEQKVLQRAYFDKIKFNKAKREIKIFNADGLDMVRGRLGTTLNYDKVYPCLPRDDRGDGSICLEWMYRARLYLHFYELNGEVKCYNVQWLSLAEDVEPTDCYDLSPSTGYWYGGGQNKESAWPLSKGLHDFAPFVTGRVNKQHEWGNVLSRYFISSKGAAITVDNSSPLYVSLNNNTGGGNKEICFKAKHDDFAFVNRLSPHPHLNYSICTASNMTRLHSLMSEKALWDGLKKEDINLMNSVMTEPLWEITAISKEDFVAESVHNYTENITLSLGFFKQGHVLINEFWQKHVGDFEVDTERFPTLEDVISIMHRRGFRVVFSIQPFISTESKSFADAVRSRILVSERFSDRRIPALTRYKSLQSAGVLDATNNRTVPWLLEKLKAVTKRFEVDAFYLDLGVAYDMPHYYQCEHSLLNPDQYKTIFVRSLQGVVNLYGVNSAIERPRAPTFVSLPKFEASWDGLQRVIPTVLTYGLIGYPFLIPGAVGGDYEPPSAWVETNVTGDVDVVRLRDKELYVRWLQLATFLPVMRFTHLPNKFGDESVLELVRNLTLLRQKIVTPLLTKYTNVALEMGLPLIRPLWMLESSDASCHNVIDEFSVGEQLIVAPILDVGQRQREIYLPAGVWRDGIHGRSYKGNRWLHNYAVEENQIAYFEKMPDNTRF